MNFLEYLYGLGLTSKRLISLKTRRRLPFRVISIGNITVGGTGKTPATIALAEEAKKRGFSPIILTRGYRGSATGPCFVTKGEQPLLTAAEAGDEPLLMADRLKGVAVIKGPDRYKAGLYALKALGSQESAVSPELSGLLSPDPLFILDDGFQHWRLFRDRDIVLIDAANPFGNGKLLPSGRLREPLSELKRADILMVTKAEREDAGLVAELRRYNTRAPLFFSSHRASAVRTASGRRMSIEWLREKNVFCFCGLAEPVSFRATVTNAGALASGMKAYQDHHPYSSKDIEDIIRESSRLGASWIVTTEKDFVKIRNLDLPENILIIEIEFAAGRNFYDSVFA